MATIPVLVDAQTDTPSGTLGVLSPGSHIKEVEAENMARSLSHLATQIAGLLQDVKKVGQFELKQVQVQVGITAEGGVALIGLAKAGVNGAMTLTFAL